MISRALKAKAEALLVAVFLLGVVGGILATNFYQSRFISDPPEVGSSSTQTNGSDAGDRRERNGGRFRRDATRFHDYLDLTAEQRAQVDAILEETRTEFRQLSAQTGSQYEAIREKYRDRIRALLDEEQRSRYDRVIESQRNRFGQRRNRD